VDVMDWKNVGWPVAHAAAIAWQAVKAGETLTVLSLEPELYAGTGMTSLNLPDPLFSRVSNRPITDGISSFHDREVRTNTPVSPAARHCSFPPRADPTITFGKRMMSESDETGRSGLLRRKAGAGSWGFRGHLSGALLTRGPTEGIRR
jgi:hypothetical protein